MKGFNIKRVSKASSTNILARGYGVGQVVIADVQSDGKGRFNRKWSSGFGGVYMSIVLPLIDKPQYYTFTAAIAVHKAISRIIGEGAVIKWPNDILFGGKKLCGILTENIDKSIVGIGLNVNNKIISNLASEATSLKIIKGEEINKEDIIKEILKYFNGYLQLINDKKYSKIISDWKKRSFLGTKVRIKTMNKEFLGVAFDLDEDGFLIVKSGSKNVRVIEGDVSLL